ncbi:MAG: SixA phosphatase family protein [Myxococcales bacterium]
MTRMYLVRHAEAVEVPPGLSFLDDLRALTPRGRKRFRRTVRAFARLEEDVHAIRASPSLRALQTAELLAAHLNRVPVAVLDDLRPGVAAAVVHDWLLHHRFQSIALVGHGRQLRGLARLFLGPELPFSFKKGCIVRIDLHGDRARPRWWLNDDDQALAA